MTARHAPAAFGFFVPQSASDAPRRFRRRDRAPPGPHPSAHALQERKAQQLVSAPDTQSTRTTGQTPAAPSDAPATATADAPETPATLPSEEHHHPELFGIPIPQNSHEAEVVAHLARRTAKRKLSKAVRIVLELGLILTICLAGKKISELLPFDMPSNICSMIVLLVFLVSGVLRMESIADGADFLLDHMSIFFIPAAVAIMGSFDLLAGNILKLILICLITTILVFFVTSFTVSTVMNLMMRHDAKVAAEVGMDGEAAAVANAVEMVAAVQAYVKRREQGESSEAALLEAEAEARANTTEAIENARARAAATTAAPEVDDLTARLAAQAEAVYASRWQSHPGRASSVSPFLRRVATGSPSTDATREAEEHQAEEQAVHNLENVTRAARSQAGTRRGPAPASPAAPAGATGPKTPASSASAVNPTAPASPAASANSAPAAPADPNSSERNA